MGDQTGNVSEAMAAGKNRDRIYRTAFIKGEANLLFVNAVFYREINQSPDGFFTSVVELGA